MTPATTIGRMMSVCTTDWLYVRVRCADMYTHDTGSISASVASMIRRVVIASSTGGASCAAGALVWLDVKPSCKSWGAVWVIWFNRSPENSALPIGKKCRRTAPNAASAM